MIAGTVYNQVVSVLEKNPTLKKYIRYVFKGFRYNIEPDSLPCLMVEPVQNNEIEKEMNSYKDIFISLDVIGIAYNPANPETTIIGNNDYKGVLDIENDVRACLQSSYTLGNIVIDTRCSEPSLFSYAEVGKYPARGVVIPVKILYRQHNGV